MLILYSIAQPSDQIRDEYFQLTILSSFPLFDTSAVTCLRGENQVEGWKKNQTECLVLDGRQGIGQIADRRGRMIVPTGGYEIKLIMRTWRVFSPMSPVLGIYRRACFLKAQQLSTAHRVRVVTTKKTKPRSRYHSTATKTVSIDFIFDAMFIQCLCHPTSTVYIITNDPDHQLHQCNAVWTLSEPNFSHLPLLCKGSANPL